MPEYSCTPENAVAGLAAFLEARGVETSEKALNLLDDNAKMLFHQTKTKVSSEALDSARPETAKKVEKLIKEFTEDSKDTRTLTAGERAKAALFDTLLPSQYLPESVTEPIFQALEKHSAKYFQDPAAGNGEYKQMIRKVLEEVAPEVEKLGAAEQFQFAHWARDLRENYIFNPKAQSIGGKAVNNSVKGVMIGSGTAIVGNVFEFTVKAPSLYGLRPTFGGMAEMVAATKGNLWKTIPEIEAAGGYGYQRYQRPGLLNKALDIYDKAGQAVMDSTNRPLLNLAYYTGKAKGGTHTAGMEAIEKIAFKNRIGNDARMGRAWTKDQTQLMNYTLNHYRMFYDMGRGMMTPGKRAESLRQFGMWFGMTSLVGGGVAATVPAWIAGPLRSIDSGYKEWEKQNMNAAGKLVQPGSISLYTGASVFNRIVESAERSLIRGTKKIQDGDVNGGLLDYSEGGMSLSTVLGTPVLGNLRFQKTFKNARDLFEGDIDYDEFIKLNAESFLPALKQD